MKKMLFIFLLLTLLPFNYLSVDATSMIDFNEDLKFFDFESKYETWPPVTKLTFTWKTIEEMTSLKIDVLTDSVKESPFDWPKKHNTDWEFSDSKEEDGYYHYYLQFKVDSGSYGKISLVWYYTINDVEKQASILIQTDNRNVTEEDFTPSAVILIGFITTICAGIGTTLLYMINQKDLVIFEDEDEV